MTNAVQFEQVHSNQVPVEHLSFAPTVALGDKHCQYYTFNMTKQWFRKIASPARLPSYCCCNKLARLVAWNNTNSLSYNSPGQKSKAGLPEAVSGEGP